MIDDLENSFQRFQIGNSQSKFELIYVGSWWILQKIPCILRGSAVAQTMYFPNPIQPLEHKQSINNNSQYQKLYFLCWMIMDLHPPLFSWDIHEKSKISNRIRPKLWVDGTKNNIVKTDPIALAMNWNKWCFIQQFHIINQNSNLYWILVL